MTVIAKVWGCTQLPELAKRQGHTQVNLQENTCFSVSLTWQVRLLTHHTYPLIGCCC